MAKGKKITKSEYVRAKQLISFDVPLNRIATFMNRSYPTLKRIADSKDYKDYTTPKQTKAPSSLSSESPNDKKDVSNLSDLQAQLNTQSETLKVILSVQKKLVEAIENLVDTASNPIIF